ncbi:MAG TPA: DinB family protein [Ruania sp.]|nr:DinB family protein [Ruania sp.]
MSTTPVDYNHELLEQITFHRAALWDRRLAGLTDEEYFWSPAPDAWSIHPRGTSTAPIQGGVGEFTIDFALPEPDPAPFTTIAWRLAHVIVGVLATRNATHFGAPAASYESWEYAGTAEEALAQLNTQLDTWLDGVASLGQDGLAVPVGEAEPYPEAAMAVLVLHINRELIHHLSEVCLLRDLYLHTHGDVR